MTDTAPTKIKQNTIISIFAAASYGIGLILMDILIANRYGTGTQAAIYQAAYTIPTLLIGIFSGGAILGSFIPIFVRLGGTNHMPEAKKFLRSTLGTILTTLIPVMAILMWASPLLAKTVASGFNLTERQEVTDTLRIMMPMIIPHAVAYVYNSALISNGKVAIANLGPVIIPIAGMVTYPWWEDNNGAKFVAIGYLLGTVFFSIVTGFNLWKNGFQVRPARPSSSVNWKTFLHSYLTMGMALAALSLLLLINQIVAGSLSARDLAAFTFGSKLVLLALAFFTTIVNSVALPHFSQLTQNRHNHEIRNFIIRFVFISFCFSTIFAVSWIILADFIIDLIYKHGSFNYQDAHLVANVQRAFIIQIPFYVVGIFCWRMLNAIGKWIPLMKSTIPALFFNFITTTLLANKYHVYGIATIYSLSIAIWSTTLLYFLCKELKSDSGISFNEKQYNQ